MAKNTNNEHLKVVGDYASMRADQQNIDHTGNRVQRDPAGPNPEQDKMVQCAVCGSQYLEHLVAFRNRDAANAWWCKVKDCTGKNIGPDVAGNGCDIHYVI